MSWSRIKTMLILLFIFVNGFMIYNIYYKNSASSEVTSQTIAETVKILEKNNVKIDPDIIRRKAVTMKKAEISNSIDARSDLAANLLGTSVKDGWVYTSPSGKLTFNSVAFLYENYDNSGRKSNISDSNAINLAVEFLNEKGFDVKSSGVRDYTTLNDRYIVKFGKEIDGYTIYESYLNIHISKKGELIKIEGYWPEVYRSSYDNRALKVECINETTVLINLLFAEGFDSTKENEIVDIKTGYTLGGLPQSDSPILLTLLPAYRITLKNGENYIFDASNGEFIYKY